MFKPGQISSTEAALLNKLLLDVRYIKALKVAAPLRIRRDPAGMCIEQVSPEQNPDEGFQSGSGDASGDGRFGDLTSIVIGPYLTDVSVACVTNSGGQTVIQVTKTWGISTVTGVDLSVVQSVYTP